MSGLTFVREEGEPVETYTVTERLCLTEDDRLVPEGHADARWLFAVPGQAIKLADAERYGLVGEPAKEEGDEAPPVKKNTRKRAEKGS